MNLLNNDIENDYIEIINNYFNEWSSIKNAEQHKDFFYKTPPKFGMFEVSILDQINNFIEQGTKIEINEITYKLFKDEVKTLLKTYNLGQTLKCNFYFDTPEDYLNQLEEYLSNMLWINQPEERKKEIDKIYIS